MFMPTVDASLMLSGADLQALCDAQLALLASPLAPATQPCSHAVSRLLGTPYAALCLHHEGSWQVEASRADLGTRLLQVLDHRGSVPAVDGSWHSIGVHAATADGEGWLWAAFEASSTGAAAVGQARLNLLAPALHARLHQPRPEPRVLLTTIERLGEPLAIYSGSGIALCHSSAFRRRLQADPDAERIYAAARQLAVRLCASPPDGAGEPPPAPPPVRTKAGRYELHGSRLSRHLMARPAALIHLRTARSRMPTKARLNRRLGLTEREAEVALLVAEGLTSKEIAQRLHVSTNTVRRHGEKVLEKLGLHTRAGVAMALLREG